MCNIGDLVIVVRPIYQSSMCDQLKDLKSYGTWTNYVTDLYNNQTIIEVEDIIKALGLHVIRPKGLGMSVPVDIIEVIFSV